MFNKDLLKFPSQIKIKNFSLLSGIFITIFLTSCACTDTSHKPQADKKDRDGNEVALVGATDMPTAVVVTHAVAVVNSLKEGMGVKGKVTFTKVSKGVKIVADFEGLTPGEHGFHIHEHGDCGGVDAASAGAHFNPTKKSHGGPDFSNRHVGDLGNIVADAQGKAHYERIDNIISLDGKDSIVGKSIIVHADKDDFKTQPAGASGSKVACGIIKASR